MTLNDVSDILTDFTNESLLNRAPKLGNMRIYDPPILRAASADDPLFALLKLPEAIGPRHMSPHEWLPGGKVAISYFLPFTSTVRVANREPGLPAIEWVHARVEGEVFNNAVRQRLVDLFADAGRDALAPILDPRFSVVDMRSNWSERHVAFIAGLGTFSINHSLITPAGSAGRLGSAIVDCDIPPTRRPYSERDEYCTHCGACIRRCPPSAVTMRGKDHVVCSAYVTEISARFAPRFGCGKCQTAVPCEHEIPRGAGAKASY